MITADNRKKLEKPVKKTVTFHSPARILLLKINVNPWKVPPTKEASAVEKKAPAHSVTAGCLWEAARA